MVEYLVINQQQQRGVGNELRVSISVSLRKFGFMFRYIWNNLEQGHKFEGEVNLD